MEIFGISGDVILVVLFVAGWFVTMRFILPRLGIST